MSDAELGRVRNAYLVVVAVLATFAFEARIVFGSFRSFVALPFPWSVILVTAGLLTLGFIAFNILILGDRYRPRPPPTARAQPQH